MDQSSNFLDHCDCGNQIERCVTCSRPRCASCEPYVSDDCLMPALAS